MNVSPCGFSSWSRSATTVTSRLPLYSSTWPAVLARQRLEAPDVEAAGGDHHAVVVVVAAAGLDEGDDVVDVVLDVDAGLLLELCLPVLVVGHRGAQLLAELGAHHVLHVGVGHQGGVCGHVVELGGAVGPSERPHRHAV